MAEFAANNHASKTTGMSRFFVIYGQDLLWQFDLTAIEELEHSLLEEQHAQQVSAIIKEIIEHLQAEIFHAQHC